MVTTVPTGPLAGLNELITGGDTPPTGEFISTWISLCVRRRV
jgi:hypothetical protein